MDKGFQFQLSGCVLPQNPNLFQRHLPCQHYPRCAQLIPGRSGGRIDNSSLRGDVQLCMRAIFLCHAKYAQICHNQCVYPNLFHEGQIPRQRLQLLGARQGINRHMHPYAAAVAVRHSPAELFLCEVWYATTHSKLLASQIHCICAKGNRHLQPFRVTGRR